VRGHIGLVLPNREALLARLTDIKAELDNTLFSVVERDNFVKVTSPWGNVLHCFEPAPEYGHINLGMPYVEFDVPIGAASGIAKFYRDVFGTVTSTAEDAGGQVARCSVGRRQQLVFRETDRPIPDYDGHHIQIYLADFSSPHAELEKRGLVFEESGQFQYRFKDIVDVDTGEPLFTLEHEVRSMSHPLFGRPLVNRDPSMNLGNFALGHEDWAWSSIVQN
jgi:hypothetical protein